MSKQEQNDSYKSQQKVSFFNFLAELPNFIAVTVSAIISGSLIVWMDFVDSLGNVLNSGFVSTRRSGNTTFVDLELSFGDQTTYAEIKTFCCDIQKEIERHIESSKVSIVISGDLLY